MLIGRIVIETSMDEEGHLNHNVEASDSSGEELGLMESLGMIEMAKDSLLRYVPMDDDEEDD